MIQNIVGHTYTFYEKMGYKIVGVFPDAKGILLYRELLKLYEYQSECEISDEAESCLSLMSDIADDAVTKDDKEYIYKHCLNLISLDDGKDYGTDYEDILLKIMMKFATSERRAEIERVLAQTGFCR